MDLWKYLKHNFEPADNESNKNYFKKVRNLVVENRKSVLYLHPHSANS